MVSKDVFHEIASVLEDGDAHAVLRAMIDECDDDTVYRIFDRSVDIRRSGKISEMRVVLSTLEAETADHVDDEGMHGYIMPSRISASVESFRDLLELYDILGRRSDMYAFLADMVVLYREASRDSRRYREEYLDVARRLMRAMGSDDPFSVIYKPGPPPVDPRGFRKGSDPSRIPPGGFPAVTGNRRRWCPGPSS
ncbi:MAG: hypothetical protein IKD00_02565 [Candidatus Methanomethylophilaceae archaeon]|nr:hypothetical protein [Candidatus Methanomethylophilaceae archaeon]